MQSELVAQDIFTGFSSFPAVIVHGNDLKSSTVSNFVSKSEEDKNMIAVVPLFHKDSSLAALAIATQHSALVIRFTSSSKRRDRTAPMSPGMKKLLEVLSGGDTLKAIVLSDTLASALHIDLGARITNARGVISLRLDAHDISTSFTSFFAGHSIPINEGALRKAFQCKDGRPVSVALQAWIVYRTALVAFKSSSSYQILDTARMRLPDLNILSTLARNDQRLEGAKPFVTKNDVKSQWTKRGKDLVAQGERYKSRLRNDKGQTQLVRITDKAGLTKSASGRVKRVNGREATIAIDGKLPQSGTISITTIGKDSPTSAEQDQQSIVRSAFYNPEILCGLPLFIAIWTTSPPNWTSQPTIPAAPPIVEHSKIPLNVSQRRAVRAILNNRNTHRIVVIEGPPGTGKTTVIASSVASIIAQPGDRPVWLVAHSNVAVKNIAEKLSSVDLLSFRLLVSKEFEFDWHEHLYERLYANVIRSDCFPKTTIEAERLLGDARVILCTLSMLSNAQMRPFTHVAPVETVMVDEASQIEIGAYVPLLYNFKSTLAKLVFIGDDKQLPPYKQEEISSLKMFVRSFFRLFQFELTHKPDRMPHVVGKFISKSVYGGKLQTCHRIKDRSACRFVDIIKSAEISSGTSWINEEEANAAVKIAARYRKMDKTYRIISPYDAQRALIERKLKSEKLPSGDICFNVDSFQGNEADHIIVCLVRSAKVGFVSNLRRSNVMLSRCKQSMIICTSRNFVAGIGKGTLAGKLAVEGGTQAWINWSDFVNERW